MTKTLQKLIDRTASTQNAYHRAQAALDQYCEDRYGHSPSDIDCDWIIDALYGGCGAGGRMSAKEFDSAMKEALEMKRS